MHSSCINVKVCIIDRSAYIICDNICVNYYLKVLISLYVLIRYTCVSLMHVYFYSAHIHFAWLYISISGIYSVVMKSL